MKLITPSNEICAMARLLIEPHENMTIAVAFRVSVSIYDTVIVAATDSAANLFGYESGTLMSGLAVSALHNPDDIKNTRKRATMRTLGVLPRNDDYPIRIITKQGEQKGVIKHVEMRRDEQSDLSIWISRHEPRRSKRPTPSPDVPVPQEKIKELYGQFTIAEAESVLGGAVKDKIKSLTVPPVDSIIHDKSVESEATEEYIHDITVNEVMNTSLRQLNGKIIRSKTGTQKRICVCYKCGNVWTTRTQKRPRECPDCHVWTWDSPIIYGPGGIVLGHIDLDDQSD